MIDEYFYEVVALASLVGGGLFLAGLRNPVVFFYAGLFGTAILKTPELPIVREKFTVVELCLLCLWMCWPLLLKSRLPSKSTGLIYLWGGGFCIVCLASSLIAITTAPPRMVTTRMAAWSLLEAVNYCYGVAILWTCVQVLDTWQRWVGAIMAWVGGMAVASFVGAAAVAGVAPGWAYEETGRINSTLRNENQVPSMILPLLVIVLMIAVRRGLPIRYRVLALGIFMAALLAAIGTGSRTAALMIGLSGAGVFWILQSAMRSKLSVYRFQLVNLAIGFAALVVVYFVFAWSQYDGKYSLMSTPSWQRPAVLLIEWSEGKRAIDGTRPQQIAGAMEYFWHSPVLGTGPKFGSGMAELHGEVHNTYFSLLLETGFVGLSAFLALVWLAAYLGFEAARKCPYPWYGILGRGLIVGLFLLCLYNATILGLRQRNIWFLMGMLLAFSDLVLSGVRPEATLPRWIPQAWKAIYVDEDGDEDVSQTTQPALPGIGPVNPGWHPPALAGRSGKPDEATKPPAKRN